MLSTQSKAERLLQTLSASSIRERGQTVDKDLLDVAELAVGFTFFHLAFIVNDPHFSVSYLLFYRRRSLDKAAVDRLQQRDRGITFRI